MHSNIGNFSPARVIGLMLALIVAGFLLRALELQLAGPAVFRSEQLLTLAGRGGVTSVLGGLRSVVADGYWLQANLAWERRDAAAMEAFLGLTVAADERPLYFWLNGARMIACDVPAWQPVAAPLAVRRRAGAAQAHRALRWLEQGLRWHGADSAFHVEMANIHLRLLDDPETAARCYRLAAEQPGAPYYAARIYAELLRSLGRPAEALAWLRQLLPGLPDADPAARREVVQARIRALEQELAGR